MSIKPTWRIPILLFIAFSIFILCIYFVPWLELFEEPAIWFNQYSEVLRNLAFLIVAVVGAPMAIWRTTLSSKNSKIAYKNTEIADRNSFTDTFTKAIEQLGATTAENKPNIEVRLGAIYALEKLSKVNSDYYQPIIDILCSYVRQHAPYQQESEQIGSGQTRIDVQTVLTVIGRRGLIDNEPRLNLASVYLRGINLKDANLHEANLMGAGLMGADLTRANLGCADLIKANLIKANLSGANLSGADLRGARMVRANLGEADLRGARMVSAHLGGADLYGANLMGANLLGADLHGARMVKADLHRADLTKTIDLTKEQLMEAKNWGSSKHDLEL